VCPFCAPAHERALLRCKGIRECRGRTARAVLRRSR
jgi:AhpD family alkylhydroperoxidase